MKKKPFLSMNFIIILLIYLVIAFFLQRYHHYDGLNANTIGAITVALEYARGNFYNAINGFWPPLISWLIVPFLKLGINPLIAGRIVMVAAAFFLFVGIRELSYKFDISERLRNVILFSSFIITLSYTKIIFPDLLILCFLILYLNIVFDSEYPNKIHNGILGGVFGAFAYFSKHYALPFFVSHFLLINILHYLRSSTKKQKKNVLRNAVAGIAIFSLLSGAWIFLMSYKYDYFTIGTSGTYNLAKLSPEVSPVPAFRGKETADPVYYMGLLKPTYKTSLSAWDDPTYVAEEAFGDVKVWSNPKYLIVHILKSSFRIVQIFIRFFSILSIPIIVAYILFCIQPFKKLILRGDVLYPFITLILYSSGYTLSVIYHETIGYLWFDNMLLLLMGGQVISILFRNEFFNSSIRKSVLIILFVMSFVALPSMEIINKTNRGEINYALSEKIVDHYNVKGNIASNNKWGYTLEIVYYLNLINKTLNDHSYYYGMPKKNQSNEDLLNELKINHIDFYFVWGESSFSHNYKDITEGKLSDLKIYSMKKTG